MGRRLRDHRNGQTLAASLLCELFAGQFAEMIDFHRSCGKTGELPELP